MASNIWKYLIGATQNGLKAGIAMGEKRLDEQNRFAQQQLLHRQTLGEEAARLIFRME